MWTRSELKGNAKNALRRYYWMGFLVCLVGGMLSAASQVGNYLYGYRNGLLQTEQLTGAVSSAVGRLAGLLLPLAVAASLLGILFSLLVSNPLQIGFCRYFSESRTFKSDFTTLFWSFSGGRYKTSVKAALAVWWRVLLWSAMLAVPGAFVCVLLGAPKWLTLLVVGLLSIPGTVKEYQYSQVLFLLAENPRLETRRLLELSTRMTDGEKWRLFVLDLSFTGWIMLGMLLCGVGLWFVTPYIWATSAEAYALLREKAFAMGFATRQELPGLFPDQPGMGY